MSHYTLVKPKARIDIKNGQLKAIKAVLRLSRCHVHAMMFEFGFYFQSLTTLTKPITNEAPIYLGHQCICHALRFIKWLFNGNDNEKLHVDDG